jgi:hypothetical protein
MKLYGLLGRRIQTLVDGELEAGTHFITWEPKGIARGVSIYRREAGACHRARRLILVRERQG